MASGAIIAGLGFVLLRRRLGAAADPRGHTHPHEHDHHHDHGHEHTHSRRHPTHHHGGDGHSPEAGADGHAHGGRWHRHAPEGAASFGQLLALGVSGGIVPCPAALVVLLSALALHRVGFGLLLIVAFSAGLATVLIAIGLLIVHARRLMARVDGRGALVTRWLPMTSAAMITLLGLGMVLQALAATGLLPVRPS